MKSFQYMGKFKGEDDLPKREHPPGAVPYKEPQSMKKLAVVANGIALVVTILMLVLLVIRIIKAEGIDYGKVPLQFSAGCLLMLASMVPHEFLHGIAMQGDVKMYQNLKQGMLFVISVADMSKGGFIFMSLLPNVVFGVIPFVIFLICPKLVVLGSMGAFAVGAGAGDYLNVYNTIRQVPKGAKVYMSGMHSYWYQ